MYKIMTLVAIVSLGIGMLKAPTEFGGNPYDWKLAEMLPCYDDTRKRSMTELLFCMLRAKNNDSN